MKSTYRNREESAADRKRIERFALTINAADTSIRMDDCRCWCIAGKSGVIYTAGADAFLLVVLCRSARAWSAAKSKLSFCSLLNDCDDEGCLRLDRLPTAAEAVVIRKVVSIYQSHGDASRFKPLKIGVSHSRTAEEASRVVPAIICDRKFWLKVRALRDGVVL